jgi:replicative DNA helicase Mcm
LVLHNTISIAKANIQATLRAQTSVLAAANPKLGRFDPYTSIAQQIDLPPTLINRFDLIFPVRDIPNKERDEKIASHVLELQKKSGKIESEINNKLLRKYIAYAKQNVKPILTDGAVEEIKRFYVNLRNAGQSSEEGIRPIPISARQLEALVRLSEASAKVRLSKEVKRKDAKRAIEILTYCLTQVGIDPETGKIDIDRISTGISASQRGRIVTIREIIKELEGKYGKSIPIEAIIEEAGKKGYKEDQVEEAIEKLKREAEIFSPKQNFVSRL